MKLRGLLTLRILIRYLTLCTENYPRDLKLRNKMLNNKHSLHVFENDKIGINVMHQ